MPVHRPLPRRRWRRLLLVASLVFVVPHVLLLGTSVALQMTLSPSEPFPGIAKFEEVEAGLWRGAAPTSEGYAELAARGVTRVVDLRAELEGDDRRALASELRDLGIQLVTVPIRDGHAPNPAQLALVDEAIDGADGPVFVNCGAGVGRTGSVIAAHRIEEGHGRLAALADNFGFGPMSIEQIAYVLTSEGGTRPPLPVRVISRVVDAPRRLMSILG